MMTNREVHLDADEDDLIVEAAGLVNMTVNDFLIGSAVERARSLVDGHRTIKLSDDAHERFFAALNAPVSVDPKFAEQARKARRIDHG